MLDIRRWRSTLCPAVALVLTAIGAQAAPTRGPLRISATPTRFADADGRTAWLSGALMCCRPFAATNGWPWISQPMMDRVAQSGRSMPSRRPRAARPQVGDVGRVRRRAGQKEIGWRGARRVRALVIVAWSRPGM
jgi:hypothetical protein